jgi:hypothetical protein
MFPLDPAPIAPSPGTPGKGRGEGAARTAPSSSKAQPHAIIPPIPPSRSAPFLIAASAAAILLLAGVIVIIRNKEGKELSRVNVLDGATITIQPDDTKEPPPPASDPKPVDMPTTAPASPATDPSAIPASADHDRRAAEWVLSIGGTMSIKENGRERRIGAVGDLPRGAF